MPSSYEDALDLMQDHGVRPTANRIMILRTLLESSRPLSMQEIETALESVDKSIISRTIAAFKEKHLLHILEDGSDSVRYEVCRAHHGSEDDLLDEDAHVHFHCEVCGKTFCFENVHIPKVEYPEGFQTRTVNYMAKGVCPECLSKKN